MDYREFLTSKQHTLAPSGIEVSLDDIHPMLFAFQKKIVRWAVRKGRSAIFADTGLGKTLMQIEYARLIGKRTLIISPLSVTRQTVREAQKIGVIVAPARSQSECSKEISITNYEMVSEFDPSKFEVVVLDESSILKALDGKTRTKLIEMFIKVPYRLCCTATPAPNDIVELGSHAQFLGVSTHQEMLSQFFVHDSASSAHGGWRIKGHAEDAFYAWLASWGMSVRLPSDIGEDDDGFVLPELRISPVFVDSDLEGRFPWAPLKGIQDRSTIRKLTTKDRVRVTVDMVKNTDDQWVVWCGTNQESEQVARFLDGSVEVTGSDTPEVKAAAFEAFQDGKIRVLVTKARIGGFGLNLQNSHRMAFVGLGDSFEQYYQCIRRCYRFGQTYPVDALIVLSESERSIYDNVMRKEREAEIMRERLIEHVRGFEKQELQGRSVFPVDEQETAARNGWKIYLGDCVEQLPKIESDAIHLSVFSPPFASLYTYSATPRDLGNSRNHKEFFAHMRFVIKELLRVTMPGRNCCVHVSQIPTRKAYDGHVGVWDFRGEMIRAFERDGWIYYGEVCIDKDPQAQAVRTHAKQLLFVQFYKDSAWSAPAYADYLLIFRKPGENPVPVIPDLTREQWIEWARPVWKSVRMTHTLNATIVREEKDERHLVPLQLDVIDRAIRLWSNPNETILSPFAGIGSEGYMALRLGRKFIGMELKRGYYEQAIKNLGMAREGMSLPLFDLEAEEVS